MKQKNTRFFDKERVEEGSRINSFYAGFNAFKMFNHFKSGAIGFAEENGFHDFFMGFQGALHLFTALDDLHVDFKQQFAYGVEHFG
ncbi:hypothetical protein SDC9_187723 [bioreactor metagenome]|uniref:Uncharacterized protein n=1 Tax=bioreactor metagenome TaxID=1076179 RepID=A0A645HMK8_9ZZZZ